MNQFLRGPYPTLSIPLGPFKICIKILGDICNFVFIDGLIDTGDQLFTRVTNNCYLQQNIGGVVGIDNYALSRTFTYSMTQAINKNDTGNN